MPKIGEDVVQVPIISSLVLCIILLIVAYIVDNYTLSTNSIQEKRSNNFAL